MNDSFEQRTNDFQYKIQQKLNLANDEIDRLKLHYAFIQGEITEISDKLNKMNVLMPQTKLIHDGIKKRSNISTNTLILKIKKEYDLKIQQIQKKHSEEIDKLNHDFSKTLNEIEHHAELLTKEEVTPIFEEMDKTQQSYNDIIYSSINYSNNYSSRSSFYDLDLNLLSNDEILEHHQKENQRIAKLQRMIKRKNDERLQCILNGKSKLQQCVDTLDQMEEEHTNRMNYFAMKISNLDNLFEKRINNQNEKHKNTLDKLNEKQKKYEGHISMIRGTIQKVQEHHKKQINDTLKEGSVYQSQIANQNSSTTEEIKLKHNEQSTKLDQLHSKLQALENDLVAARTENDSLKREFNRLKHEEKMQSRIYTWKNRLSNDV